MGDDFSRKKPSSTSSASLEAEDLRKRRRIQEFCGIRLGVAPQQSFPSATFASTSAFDAGVVPQPAARSYAFVNDHSYNIKNCGSECESGCDTGYQNAGCFSGLSIGKGYRGDHSPRESSADESDQGDGEEETPKFTEKETLALLAREMNALSMDEREKVTNDIHGLVNPIEETEELKSECLKQFQIELDRIRQKNAYEDALRSDQAFVNDVKFRLIFLRVEQYDAKLAAKRYAVFFEEKLKLFGKSKLTKPIEFSDLSQEEQEFVLSGEMQFLPNRDRAGRLVFYCTYPYRAEISADNVVRALFYVFLFVQEDIASQRRGMVMIVNNIVDRKATAREYQILWKSVLLGMGNPIYCAAFHYCCRNDLKNKLGALLRGNLGKNERLRMRDHMGTSVEIQYALMTFGLSVQGMSAEGELPNEYHLKWVAERQAQENRRALAMVVPQVVSQPRTATSLEDPMSDSVDLSDDSKKIVPTPKDVLFGRGASIRDNPGNIAMNRYVEQNHARYEESDKWQKTIIASEIVQNLKSQPARFLKNESGRWAEVSDETARKKVCHTFRSLRRQQKNAIGS